MSRVVGCTTAGEISSEGYTENEIVALGFRESHFAARTALIEGLQALDATCIAERAVRLRAELAQARPDWRSEFAFLLIDGLSRREDQLVTALRLGLGGVPLFGGSAGDGLDFRRTLVLAEGRVHEDAAVLTLLRSRCPVKVFKVDHLVPSGIKMVVTEADPERRLVREINAEPAAREYARLVGKDPDQLSPFIFAANPVVVRVGGQHHVRAIQSVEANGDLRFLSAIDEGLVLTLAEATGLAAAPRARPGRARPRAPARGDHRLRLHPAPARGRAGAGPARDVAHPLEQPRRRLLDLRRAVQLGAREPDADRGRDLPARGGRRGAPVTSSLVNPADTPERQTAKLLKVTAALMRRVERATDDSGEAYAHFQRAILLEEQVRNRTRDLEQTLDLLNRSNARLSQAMQEAERARADLFDALEAVREGFALFDADDVLVMCNSRFGMALPDVTGRLKPGLKFIDYAKALRPQPLPDPARRHEPAGVAAPAARQPPQGVGELQRPPPRRRLDPGERAAHPRRRHRHPADRHHRADPHGAAGAREAARRAGAADPRHARPHQPGHLHLRRPASGWSAGTPGCGRCSRRRSS